MLEMRQVSKIYRTAMVETHALRSLDLHVREGEFVAVTGPSGSGKTTFLNIAGLLETFSEGDYLLDGQNVRGMSDDDRSRLRNHKIGFIFQGFNLIPDLNLFDNVDVPLRYRGFDAADRRQRIVELERESARLAQTQLFIEAPYRNDVLLEALLAACKPGTRLCLATDLTSAEQTITTRTIGEWRRLTLPRLDRRPTVFLMLG